MAIRVVHGRAVWHPPYSKVRLPRAPKPGTPYAKLPYSKPSKLRKGGMVARDNSFYSDFVQVRSSGTTVSQRVRFRDVFSPTIVRPGNFKDPTPHAYEHRQYWYPNGRQSSSAGYDEGPLGEDYGIVLDESGAIDSQVLYNQTLKKLYDQLRDSDLNLTIDVAEWRQLRSMLATMRRRLIPQFMRWARKARKRQRRGMTLDEARLAIGNAWLEYQYGWRPLASSIYGIACFERSILSHRKLLARTTSRNTWHVHKPAEGVLPPVQWTVKHSARCEIGMTYRVSNALLFDLTRAVSLNPLAIAWELMPYSFVVDWFVDIGGYMQSMEQSFFAGLQFEKGYVTYTTKVDIDGAYRGTWGSGFVINAPYKIRVTRLSRAPLHAPPRPYLPGFTPRLGWQRMLSAASLLSQLLSPDPKLLRS